MTHGTASASDPPHLKRFPANTPKQHFRPREQTSMPPSWCPALKCVEPLRPRHVSRGPAPPQLPPLSRIWAKPPAPVSFSSIYRHRPLSAGARLQSLLPVRPSLASSRRLPLPLRTSNVPRRRSMGTSNNWLACLLPGEGESRRWRNCIQRLTSASVGLIYNGGGDVPKNL